MPFQELRCESWRTEISNADKLGNGGLIGLYLLGAVAIGLIFSSCCLGLVRGLQISVFFLPFVFLTALLRRKVHRILSFIAAVVLSFIVFSYCGLQGYFYENYDASLTSRFIVESISNTNQKEASDYIQTSLQDIVLWTCLAIFAYAVYVYALVKLLAAKPVVSKILDGVAFLLLLLFCFSFYQDAWRNRFPICVYMDLYHQLSIQKDFWANIEKENEKYLNTAEKYITQAGDKPQTIVLVIGESMNREDMSLYGYSRKTTPRLEEIDKNERNFLKAKIAYSTRFSTVAAFNTMLEFDPAPLPGHGHVLAFFKKAGFHIVWISNQEDTAIHAEYQTFSDENVSLNRKGGRSSASMDEKVLPELASALEKAHGKTLIIVHLIGLHPHFSLRYPHDLKPNWDENDEVKQMLKNNGQSLRNQLLKSQYDLAMLYQDTILAKTFEITKEHSAGQPVSWVYLSDHGAETGRRDDLMGHSSTTLGGYTIPFLFWTNRADMKLISEDLEKRPFRGDWLSYLLLDIAGIQCRFPYAEKSWLNPKYLRTEPKEITELKKQKKNQEIY